MDTIELILKLAEIGWKGDLETELASLNDWLYRNFQISIEKESRTYYFWFGDKIMCRYFGIHSNEDIIKKILPDITLLWKCKNGKLEGPSLDNFEEPESEWT